MKRTLSAITAILLAITAVLVTVSPAGAALPWTSPNHFRTVVTVNPRHTVFSGGVNGIHSPTSVEIDFVSILQAQGGTGTFDPSTIEVVGYDSIGEPRTFDATRPGYERYLLPWRIERYYGVNRLKLCFTMPNHSITQYAVYFDTTESRLGKPDRYPGLVGDGDWFTEGYKRREINACAYDTFCDFDGDGDLDLFKSGTEPYIYCYENVGGNRFEDRGKLTSAGQPLVLYYDGNNRAWGSVRFCDWDGDGDQDLFVHCPTGPYGFQLVWYRNTTIQGGQLTFSFVGQVMTLYGTSSLGVAHSGTCLVTFADWDGDGDRDLIAGQDSLIEVHENYGTDAAPQLRFKQYVQANGVDIQIWSACCDYTDIDNDDLPDLLVGTEEGRVYFFKSVGPRNAPAFREGRALAHFEFMDARTNVKVADWDGDGLLDFVAGRYWERSQWGSDPRCYGRLFKNIGTQSAPRFEPKDALSGSPYTERFQTCDGIRQNGLRAVDWNNDGKKDLIVGDTDGFVWYFRNTTNRLFPVFAPGERIQAGDEYIRMYGEEKECRAAGYARVEVCDWNGDLKKDLLVADGRGRLYAFLNTNTDGNPVLGPGLRVVANGHEIDGTSRSSALVCDWDNDGDIDLVFGMVGRVDPSDYDSVFYDWPHDDLVEPGRDKGFLLYKNEGPDAWGLPTLGEAEWLYSKSPGGTSTRIEYTRPNLGSFVDWDSDGKKDFIGCEFEHNARFYKNTGTAANPKFESSLDGVYIVAPWTVQMMSGADAVDWNGDGDYDIVTGQGHGGSGLRFYERDQINDFVNGGLYPIVSIGASTRGYDISGAKTFGGAGSITIPRGVVTAIYTGYFYFEQTDRSSGIRVQKSSHGVTIGQMVDVTGTMTVNSNGERYILASTITTNGTGSVGELMVNSRGLGGDDLGSPPGAGQYGVEAGTGVNNIGLLVRTSGKCSVNLSATGDYYGARYMFVDDGGGVKSYYRHTDGTYRQTDGVKVDVNDSSVEEGDFLSVRGISSIELVNGLRQSKILTRPSMGDVTKL